MKTYHWKEYGFIGTVPDFARHLGVCKSQTFVNAVRRVSRHVYNCMSAQEQAEYEEKRERVKPAFRLYLDQEHTQFVKVTKEEYEAIDLPVVQEEIGTFKLCYRNRVLPASFAGDSRDEIPVASAMKKYKEEAMRFAEQVMLVTGYFNTRLPSEQPKVEISHTALWFSYSNGIVFHFTANRSRDGVCDCLLQRITLDGNLIYNGCCYRHSSVYGVLQRTQTNGECQNAHYHSIE